MGVRSGHSRAVLWLVILAAASSIGWSARTTRHLAWSAVDFLPPDLAAQVRRHHRRFDAGIERGLAAPPAWRAAQPGRLAEALVASANQCTEGLDRPIALEDLVEELGVLAVRVIDANDPLAVVHDDPREARYAQAYQTYVDSVLGRVRLVYYGRDYDLAHRGDLGGVIEGAFERSRELYPFVGEEFYRTDSLRSWKSLDDRSVAFGVAGVALSRGLTDFANICNWVWAGGGGYVPAPRPTPKGHRGPTVTLAPRLASGFEGRDKPKRGAPVMGAGGMTLPPP